MPSVFVLLVVVLAVGVGPGALAGVDYCSVHTFRSNSSWLQFTKEMSSREYYVTGAFKSLHCCAKGYRSIEWYKDGRPYPWPGSFILYPESANQTVYSPAAQAADGGNYSCLVRNDTAETWHHTSLTLVGEATAEPPDSSQYSGKALPTYAPRDQVVRLGDDARFFCEAFIGRVNLPDAHSAIWWRREGVVSSASGSVNVNSNGTTTTTTTAAAAAAAAAATTTEGVGGGGAVALGGSFHRGVLKKDTSREDEQILGVFLEIRGVRREDLGQYTCFIHSLDNQRLLLPAWLKQAEALPRGAGPEADSRGAGAAPRRLLLQLAFLLLAALTVAVLALRFGPELRLATRDALARVSQADNGSQWDALLCHAARDAEPALALLQPALVARLGYRVRAHTLTAARPDLWAEELGGAAARSRRLLALVSPALLGGAWSHSALAPALAALAAAHPALVVVAMEPLPAADGGAKDESARALRRLVRASPPVLWAGASEAARRAFWTALRLRLPPPPLRAHGTTCSSAAAAIDVDDAGDDALGAGQGVGKQPLTSLPAPGGSGGGGGGRRPQRTGSHESLEVLV